MSANNTILKKYLMPQEEDQQYPSPADSIGQPQVEPVSEATTNQDTAPQRSPASVGQNPASALALSPDAIGELRKRLAEGLSGQQANIGQIKQALMQRLGLTNQVDLSPGFEIAKASGAAANAGSSYKKPEDESQAIAETQDRLSKAQNSYTDEVQKQLKDELSNKALGSFNSQMLNETRAARLANQSDAINGRLANIMGLDLDPSKANPNSPFGKAAQTQYAAQKLKVLAEQVPDLNFNKNQMVDLATSTANLLSNGSQTAQSQVEHLLPKTVGSDAASIYDWFTNEPHGTKQREFAKSMLETAAREESLAADRLYHEQQQRLSKHGVLLKRDPTQYNLIKDQFVKEPEKNVEQTIAGFKSDQGGQGAKFYPGLPTQQNTAQAAQQTLPPPPPLDDFLDAYFKKKAKAGN